MARARWALGAVGAALVLLLALLLIPGWFVTGESGNSMLGYLADGEIGIEAGPQVLAPAEAAPVEAAEQRLIDLVNAARVAEGLLPLRRSAALAADARRQSQEMSSGDFFGPADLWGREPLWRLEELGYHDVEHLAVNLAAGLPDADSAFQAWMAAAPYRRNILDPRLREIGVGYASDPTDTFGPYLHYWTVELGARRDVYPVVIANEAAATAATQVELFVHGRGWAEEMAISNAPPDPQTPRQPYQSRLSWRLDAAQDESAVYVALFGAEGSTLVVSDTIRVQGRTVELRRGLHGYDGVADAAITSWDPDGHFGRAAELELGASARSGSGGKQALLRFDLASLAPSTMLRQAVLTLHLIEPPSQPLTLEAYALAAPWEERAANWWQAAPGILWGLPGAAQANADRQAAPLGAWAIQPTSSTVAIDLTPLVQSWLARPDKNHGLLLSGHGEAFVSCAVAASEHGREELRPSLTLYLRPGEAAEPTASPASSGLAAAPTPTHPPQARAGAADALLTLVLQPGLDGYAGAADTSLSAEAPHAALAHANALEISSDGSRAAALRFDLAPLPPSARVQRATLGLYAVCAGAHPLQLAAYGLARDWDARQANWLSPRSGETWAVPGGEGPGSDRAPYPSGSAMASGGSQWVELDVTDLVEAWMRDPLGNAGLIVKGESEVETQFAFASAEYSRPELRPRLAVTYTQP